MFDELEYSNQVDRIETVIESAGLSVPERAELYRVRNFLVALWVAEKHAVAGDACPNCGLELRKATDTGILL